MRLEIASAKAVKYAIMNWHYSKAIPSVSLAFSVFEGSSFCGVICYGLGATYKIGKSFGLQNGQCIELVRVALNGKQTATSKAMSISLKLLKKYSPLVKLVVSYADTDQGHTGILYQATNWYYIGSSTDTNIIVNGRLFHRRTLSSKYGTNSVARLKEMGLNVGETIKTKPKHKYIYPIDKTLIPMCKQLAKPYPKE